MIAMALAELPGNSVLAGRVGMLAGFRKIDELAARQQLSTQPQHGGHQLAGLTHSAMAVAATCGFRECDCTTQRDTGGELDGSCVETTDGSFFVRLHEPAEQAELNKSSTACCGTPFGGANHSGAVNMSYGSQDLSDTGTLESWRLSSTPTSAELDRDRQRAMADAECNQEEAQQVDGFVGWAMLSPLGMGGDGASGSPGGSSDDGAGGDTMESVDRTPLRTRQCHPFRRQSFS